MLSRSNSRNRPRDPRFFPANCKSKFELGKMRRKKKKKHENTLISQGGLKAAILSDVIQGLTMIGVSLVIITKGSADIGPDKILNVTYERGRLDFFK